ncbi:hypothetical protein [Desulfotruncus arcticus]|uniref:hypothetical protein n=1 Tax=Desulfotruncus arcticus TaxID=341036 RepID=UPI000B870A02|nr:hypothetical protein [Desulfotruncus arcticus]
MTGQIRHGPLGFFNGDKPARHTFQFRISTGSSGAAREHQICRAYTIPGSLADLTGPFFPILAFAYVCL